MYLEQTSRNEPQSVGCFYGCYVIRKKSLVFTALCNVLRVLYSRWNEFAGFYFTMEVYYTQSSIYNS
jgi:hypothetical protein